MTTTTRYQPLTRPPSPADPLPHQLLTAIAQHRMATTAQLLALLRPGTARQTVSTPLNKLRRNNLVAYTPGIRRMSQPCN